MAPVGTLLYFREVTRSTNRDWMDISLDFRDSMCSQLCTSFFLYCFLSHGESVNRLIVYQSVEIWRIRTSHIQTLAVAQIHHTDKWSKSKSPEKCCYYDRDREWSWSWLGLMLGGTTKLHHYWATWALARVSGPYLEIKAWNKFE